MLCVIVIVHVLSDSTQNTVLEIQNAFLAELKPHLFTLILNELHTNHSNYVWLFNPFSEHCSLTTQLSVWWYMYSFS